LKNHQQQQQQQDEDTLPPQEGREKEEEERGGKSCGGGAASEAVGVKVEELLYRRLRMGGETDVCLWVGSIAWTTGETSSCMTH